MVIISAIVVWFFALLARYKGIPAVLMVLGLIAAVYTFITNKTVLGRHIYAMGGNAKAARLSGVNTERLMFFSYSEHGPFSRYRRYGVRRAAGQRYARWPETDLS